MQTFGQQPVIKDLVLVGGGHSHVVVLKRFGMRPMPGVRLTMICRETHTPYSGMLPGLIAGHYSFDQAHIDLVPLCRFAGARFYHDEAVGLDLDARTVQCRGRPPVKYDVLSIDIGSTPRTADVPGAAGNVVPVKPIDQFLARWDALSQRVLSRDGAVHIGVVGAGAGGVELLLAVQYRLRQAFQAHGRDDGHIAYTLFAQSAEVLAGHPPRVRRAFARVLQERRVRVLAGHAVIAVALGQVTTNDGTDHALDEILWVTSAGAAAWPGESGLCVDPQGFIAVNDALQSVSHPAVFAAGDIASVQNHPRPKAGVFAVRQGPPLTRNLRRALTGRPPHPFRPQQHFLSLISTGDRYAVASRGFWVTEGQWVWRWKDRIDRRFMHQFAVLPGIAPPQPAVADGVSDAAVAKELSVVAMRCGGCGAKVGSDVLRAALGQLVPFQRPDILVGLNAPDDAAVVAVPAGKVLVQTVDYFRAFIDDPYMFGQIAANHSLGDIYAMGAEPQSALAIVTLPFGLEAKVEDELSQLMAGAMKVLNQAETALAGGHTSEGAERAMGFAVNGLADPARLLRKGGMRPGDRLILGKPLGTGTLFAADMRGKAKGRWIDAALASMLQSSRAAARCLNENGATACTDITGFGLLGHLLEMVRPSGVDVELTLSALPFLDGALETVRLGILSSMQPQNLRLRRSLRDANDIPHDERYPLLFDPQTAGGLLASVPPGQAASCLAELHRLGYDHAAVIGTVLPPGDGERPIVVRA